jgi:hypothetical protein
MANVTSNPWSFTSTDQAVSKAISSIVSNGFSALVTTATAHGFTDWQWVSLQGCTTTPAYNGGYRIRLVNTTQFYINLTTPNLAANGANGNALTVAYPYKPRIEQLVWQNAGSGGALIITDTNGNPVWEQTANAADQTYTYGKLYWVDGLVLNALPSGIVLVTIN